MIVQAPMKLFLHQIRKKAKACKKTYLAVKFNGKTRGLVYSGVPFHEFSNQLLTASAKFEKLNDFPSVRRASSPDRYFPVLTRQPCNENN